MTRVTADGTDQSVSTDGCRQLLASSRVARLAFVDGGRPEIVVLNYVLDGSDIMLQTSDDTRLAARTASPGSAVRVQVEVDSVSASGRSGWSVIASGSLSRAGATRAQGLPTPWRHDATGVALRIRVDEITGRRVDAGALDEALS
jgi:nitroimidazol reductase NimA-like FMN-containing flavoprotein (pyridoxamine 5'-phosphate oxidase superfamily)